MTEIMKAVFLFTYIYKFQTKILIQVHKQNEKAHISVSTSHNNQIMLDNSQLNNYNDM